jgi:4-hydroxy-2-oxoglutarate aldolase
MKLHGIFPPIPTPFAGDEIDHRAMRENLSRWMKTGIAGVLVLSSNGEAPYIDDEESPRVIATARECIPGDRRLIAGAGRESTRASIASVCSLAKAGADVVLVGTPCYFKSQMNTDVFVRHFTAVADASPVPVLLYNVSAFTGVNLLPAAVVRLAEHPNIIGAKESNPDLAQVADLVALTPPDFQILVGSAPTLYASLCVGAIGGIVAVACVVPDLVVRLYTLVQDGRDEEALALQRKITPLARSVTATYGIGGLKAACEMVGHICGSPRLPLSPASPQAVEIIRGQLAALQARG